MSCVCVIDEYWTYSHIFILIVMLVITRKSLLLPTEFHLMTDNRWKLKDWANWGEEHAPVMKILEMILSAC